MGEGLHLDVAAARKLLREIVATGRFWYSEHCKREMAHDKLTTIDVVNVLRAGVVEPSEFEHGSWRHRVKTNRICVVVVLLSEQEAVAVTAWRIGGIRS